MDMETALNTKIEENYWSERYQEQNTGWDIGQPSEPIKTYIDQLKDKTIKILMPGAGNAHEAEYLYNQGFKNIFVMDISAFPLQNFKKRIPNFPENQLIEANFFNHVGQYDLIIEQTFFCSFEPTPENRKLYGKKMNELLKPKGKLIGLWFDIPLIEGNMINRPFGGSKPEYLDYISPYFEVQIFEKCFNSIPKRSNQELFGIFVKK
jgi:methyl halide transferase